jgi:hypothetical protein
MRSFVLIPLYLAIAFNFCLQAAERGSSTPYISGDTFRNFCTARFDELSTQLDPSQIQTGNAIFVKTDMLEQFFKTVHPYIAHPYVLVTHNSDDAVPGRFAQYLDDPRIFAWFGQNVENCNHPKMHPIPIGLANRCWDHGNIETVSKMQSRRNRFHRDQLLYMNFTESTYPERTSVFRLFQKRPYCVTVPQKPFQHYLRDLAKSKFVLSPRGNGIDCHRTWECFLMGAYPVLKTSTLDRLFEGLPVLIVQDWNQIDEEFLNAAYEKMQAQSYRFERAYADYWLGLIAQAQEQARFVGFECR